METKPSISNPNAPITTRSLFEKDTVKKKFEEMLGNRATAFITSVLQIVASNELLKGADPMSVYNAAAVAATLDLPLNNNLGFAYIVPYNGKDGCKAQFQMGYKGFKQLAIRSGQFSLMNETDVREGEIKSHDRLSGQMVFEWEQDTDKRLSKAVIGYLSYFKLANGFEHTLYMTAQELDKHGKRFSQSFRKGFGLWKDDFHSMCLKTVCKLNLSKNAPLSVDMQKAMRADQSVIKNEDATDVEHIDVTDGIEKTELEIIEEKIIAGLETYRGGDKDKIKLSCVDAKQTGDWNMDFAKEIAKKLEIEL